jgi:hypothetical protein
LHAQRLGQRGGRPQVLDALGNAIHPWERVGGYLHSSILLLTVEQGPDDRDARRRDRDGGFHGVVSSGEADGELGERLDVTGGEEGDEQDAQLIVGTRVRGHLFLQTGWLCCVVLCCVVVYQDGGRPMITKKKTRYILYEI